MAKIFCMQYPLEDFEGQYTIRDGSAHSASRYTSMRLSELGMSMFEGLDEDAIDIWFDNFDNTDKFPSVLPSLGYYNICNGTLGLAVSISSSIPQYNVREVNEAMIKLLWNPNIDFEEIYCEPDFCTGGTILNKDKVKEITKRGCGGAAIIRSDVTYDEKERSLYITHLPYAVYTEKVVEQIKKLVETGELVGIKKVNDLSKKEANIKIELERGVNVDKLIRLLYKNTSIQDAYTINMTMLDNGTIPRVFTWKEALQAHIDHEIKCYKKIYRNRIVKIDERLNIINGILIAFDNLDEVIKTIKGSETKELAKTNLMNNFGLNEAQAIAILKITLSKLAHLEIEKYKKEKKELLEKRDFYELCLNDRDTLYTQIENRMREVADKYGRERRTKCINLDFSSDDEEAEPIEQKELLIHFTNLGNIYTQESTTLLTSRRGGKGRTIKLANNETITQTINDSNYSSLLAFTNKGKMHSLNTADLPINSKVNIAQFFDFDSGEKITKLTTLAKKSEVKFFTFITKYGMIKKTKASEYEHKRGKSIKAINLKDDDEVLDVLFMNEERVGILTYNGNYVIIDTDEINAIGRASMGIKAIKLSDNDYVIASSIVKNSDKYLLVVSSGGLIKKSSIDDFPTCSRAIKGKKISGTSDDDRIVDFLTIEENCDIIVIGKRKVIKFNTSDLRVLSREAIGVKALSVENEIITGMVKS